LELNLNLLTSNQNLKSLQCFINCEKGEIKKLKFMSPQVFLAH